MRKQRILCCATWLCLASGALAADASRWVSTWATAQQMPPAARGGGRGGGGRGGGGRGPNANNLPEQFSDQTVRMIVRASLGGSQARVTLSNMTGAQPVAIGSVHLALHKSAGEIVGGSDHALTFGGLTSFSIQPGVQAVSDPVELTVAPLTEFAVSLYLPKDTGPPTNHMISLRTGYVAKGDTAAAPSMPADATNLYAFPWLASVDVLAPPKALSIVTLGDSITDGYGTTRDAYKAWPTLLAQRLNASKSTQNVGVLNMGISGNQVLRDGAGIAALARFDRDVLSWPGVKWVVLLEGINDINIRGRNESPESLTAEELIWGYKQIIARCHAHEIKVMGATIMPEEGVPTASPRGEAIRLKVNEWIRAKGNFDGVIDFEAVVRDPQHPARIRADFDPGDHIHPNDAGNQAMADAFDLKLFTK